MGQVEIKPERAARSAPASSRPRCMSRAAFFIGGGPRKPAYNAWIRPVGDDGDDTRRIGHHRHRPAQRARRSATGTALYRDSSSPPASRSDTCSRTRRMRKSSRLNCTGATSKPVKCVAYPPTIASGHADNRKLPVRVRWIAFDWRRPTRVRSPGRQTVLGARRRLENIDLFAPPTRTELTMIDRADIQTFSGVVCAGRRRKAKRSNIRRPRRLSTSTTSCPCNSSAELQSQNGPEGVRNLRVYRHLYVSPFLRRSPVAQ